MTNAAPLPSSAGPDGLLSVEDLVALEAPLRRYVLSRTGDPDLADDIVQETLLRTLTAAGSLEIETLTAYAIVVARNEINAHARSNTTARRHLPRLVDLTQPPRPEEMTTAKESREALAAALSTLPARTRLLLLAHDVHDQPLAEMAKEQDVRPGTLAMQLHRTRARLRVDYVLALRRATLPTSRCRPVLLAISAGDKRQQHGLNSGQHLSECTVCDDLSVPLLTRDRTLAGFVPWLALGAPQGAIEGFLRRQPGISTAGAVAVVAAGVFGITQVAGDHGPPQGVTAPAPAVISATSASPTTPATPPASPAGAASPAAVPNLSSFGRAVVPARRQLGAAASAPAVADAVVVVAVPGNEGFWVGDAGAAGARIWVQMTGRGESPLQVTAGMRLSFHGTIVVNDLNFVRDLGLKDAADTAALDASGIHIVVAEKAITVVR